MRFDVLGSLLVHGRGGAIDIRPGRTQHVLCVLLSRANEYVSLAELISAQWSGDPPASANQNTRRAIHWLRSAFGDPGRIAHGPAGYAVRVDPDELDAYEFARLLDDAESARDGDQIGDAADLYDRALALWRGSPYAGLEECQLLVPEIERLAHLRTQALEGRAEAYLSLGRHAKLVPDLAALVRSDPRQERLVGLYMRALYAAGRPADAQDAFWRTKTVLADELGIDPTPELQQLYEAILRGKLDSPMASGASTKPASTPVPAQLPADIFGFAGRETELARLDALLATDDSRPTAVVVSAVSGTAGVGKTTLAVHWAHHVADRFPDGQLYVNLRGFDPGGAVVAPANALRGFLESLGVAPDQVPLDVDAKAALYRSLLAHQRVLVVLDNARDVEQIRPLLPGSPACLALVTSRNDLAGLVVKEGARPLTLDLLTPLEARLLLELRVGGPRVAAEPEAVDDLVAACAGLPLALAVVAARAVSDPLLPLRTLADDVLRTRDGLHPFAVAGDPSSDVRAVISWSYEQLSPDAARLFRLLGTHPGPDISAPAAASLAGIAPDFATALLAELAQAHLVTERVPGRFAFHDLLRTFAAGLAGDVERHEAMLRVLDHYVHTAHLADGILVPASKRLALAPPRSGVTLEPLATYDEAIAWFTREHAVLLAALSGRAGFEVHVWQLALALDVFLSRAGHFDDQAFAMHAALEAARRLDDRPEQARAHRLLSNAYWSLARLDDAANEMRSALSLYSELGDLIGQARTHLAFARLTDSQGRYDEALGHGEQALELYTAADHLVGQADALNTIGWCQVQVGRPDLALGSCQRAVVIHQRIGEREGEADTWDSIGYAYHHLDDFAQAVTSYQRALAIYRELGNRHSEAMGLTRLADSHSAAGNHSAARASWREALAILDDLDHPSAETVRAKLDALDESTTPGTD